jgi:hypothetical protein
MIRHWYGRLAVVAVSLHALIAPRLIAGEPTIETLIASVPVLSPKSDGLTSFQLESEIMTWFEVPFIVKLVWCRPDRFGMVVTAGVDRTPFWFLSEKQSMDFDITSGTVILFKDVGPQFVVRADDERMKLNLSITSEAKTEVTIDLPSFLNHAMQNGTVTQESGGDWRLTLPSNSGKSVVMAVFKNCRGYPIRSLEIRSIADDSLLFAVRDICVNAKTTPAWPDFPVADSFPKGLRVVRLADLKTESHADGLGVVARGLRTVAAHGALRNPKWRSTPFVSNVDWANAQKTNDEIGPPLRILLNVEPAEPKDAGERG